MALWSTKAAISRKRVKIEKKLLWGAYRNSPSLFRTVPSPTPYGLPFSQIEGSYPPKTPIAIISGTGNFRCGQNNEKIWRKGSVSVFRDFPYVLGTPYYLRNGKSYRFQIWAVYSYSEQNPIKNFREKGASAWAYPGTAQFFGYPLLSQEWVNL